MVLPKNNKPYKKISFWLWLLGTLIITVAIILLATKTITIERRVFNLEQREPIKIIEKQPIYTTKIVEGTAGVKGRDGVDSVSKNTIVEKQTTIIQQVPVQGEKGDSGKKVEFGSDSKGNIKYYRYEGDRDWQEVPVVEVGDE